MKRLLNVLAVASLTFGGAATLSAQDPVVPEELRVERVPRQSLAGPRFGVTVFTGEIADQRHRAGLEPLMSQFGWQWETQLVSTSGGGQALLEWVALVGGVEQGETNASISFLAGLRTESGIEFGVGPNVGLNMDRGSTSRSIVVAGGVTLPVGSFFVPVNTAVAFAPGGPRLTFLTGWVVGV